MFSRNRQNCSAVASQKAAGDCIEIFYQRQCENYTSIVGELDRKRFCRKRKTVDEHEAANVHPQKVSLDSSASAHKHMLEKDPYSVNDEGSSE